MQRGRLQWGHGREAMDGEASSIFCACAAELQWGHGREAMDGAEHAHDLDRTAKLQWGHGREAMDGYDLDEIDRLRRHFNGAMAVRPWMGAGRPRALGAA